MRPEKTLIVADVREKLKSSPYLLLVDYSGMKVPHFEELRTRLAGAGARLDHQMMLLPNHPIHRLSHRKLFRPRFIILQPRGNASRWSQNFSRSEH